MVALSWFDSSYSYIRDKNIILKSIIVLQKERKPKRGHGRCISNNVGPCENGSSISFDADMDIPSHNNIKRKLVAGSAHG